MSNEIYTDFERPPGCTCTHGTKDNPVFGGYARCSIHAPWANKSEIDLPQHTFVQKPEFQPDSIVQSVIQKFKDRAQQGEKSYGVNLDRDDYTVEDWMEELGNEIHDSYLYLERFKQDFKKTKRLLNLSLKVNDSGYIHTLLPNEQDEYKELLEWYKTSQNGKKTTN